MQDFILFVASIAFLKLMIWALDSIFRFFTKRRVKKLRKKVLIKNGDYEKEV